MIVLIGLVMVELHHFRFISLMIYCPQVWYDIPPGQRHPCSKENNQNDIQRCSQKIRSNSNFYLFLRSIRGIRYAWHPAILPISRCSGESLCTYYHRSRWWRRIKCGKRGRSAFNYGLLLSDKLELVEFMSSFKSKWQNIYKRWFRFFSYLIIS